MDDDDIKVFSKDSEEYNFLKNIRIENKYVLFENENVSEFPLINKIKLLNVLDQNNFMENCEALIIEGPLDNEYHALYKQVLDQFNGLVFPKLKSFFSIHYDLNELQKVDNVTYDNFELINDCFPNLEDMQLSTRIVNNSNFSFKNLKDLFVKIENKPGDPFTINQVELPSLESLVIDINDHHETKWKQGREIYPELFKLFVPSVKKFVLSGAYLDLNILQALMESEAFSNLTHFQLTSVWEDDEITPYLLANIDKFSHLQDFRMSPLELEWEFFEKVQKLSNFKRDTWEL